MRLWRSLFRGRTSASLVLSINSRRAALRDVSDARLLAECRSATSLTDVIATTAVTAARVLGLDLFDEQLQGALALAEGRIVEMQTGEGKTLAAVPAIVWLARQHSGVHVLTANEYLAQRDAEWMRPVYDRLGLSVAAINQQMSAGERQSAYRANVTYATATEVGFDYLREGLAMEPSEQVLPPLAGCAALIDEADSILIDEARIPLVIAGGQSDESAGPAQADQIVRMLRHEQHVVREQDGRAVRLTPSGIQLVERALRIDNLFDPAHLDVHVAVQDALHAHVLLQRDVDYVVQDDAVLSVDEVKGRIVSERRWPAGLQTALEWKEGVRVQCQGRILGSVTIENLLALYQRTCGMTGTAVTQAQELRDIYGLRVVDVPPHRPVIRDDRPDRLFKTRAEKEDAVIDEIRRVHATGRPVLVGTASVEESERLSARLGALPHTVLNARHEAREAEIIARAGHRDAVTISTNMAGRGVDILLGEGVEALGGLHVIGTNRHHSRRIDHQLRGRAGRQGDPGSSQFFVSREDSLFSTNADAGETDDVGHLQRVSEGRSLDTRLFLKKYESVTEAQRLTVRERRDAILHESDLSSDHCGVWLETIDELWADYLVAVGELRAGTPWLSLGGLNPHAQYLKQVHAMFGELLTAIDEEGRARVADAGERRDVAPRQRGATWTYLTTDEPFGSMTDRILRQVVASIRGKWKRS